MHDLGIPITYISGANCSSSWYHGYNYEVNELNEEEVSTENFVSPHDRLLPISDLTLSKSSFVPEKLTQHVDPDEEVNEATGNKGATIEKHYRCRALVLWHSKNRPLVMGADSKLKEDIERAGILSEMERKRYVGVAQDLVLLAKSLRPNSAADLLSCLKALGEKDVLHQFLTSDIANYIEPKRFRNQLLNIANSKLIVHSWMYAS